MAPVQSVQEGDEAGADLGGRRADSESARVGLVQQRGRGRQRPLAPGRGRTQRQRGQMLALLVYA